MNSIKRFASAVVGMVAAAIATQSLPKIEPVDQKGVKYLSRNVGPNRAERRSHAKLRKSAPGAFGSNQMARIVRWQRNHPDITTKRSSPGIFGV